MSEFYKMEPLKWDRGTDNLTLEQEAAYLRICNAIYAADQPIAANLRTLAGMWRCNERKAKRLLSELIEAGKVTVSEGWITNEKAMNDVSIRLQLRVKRQLTGRRGGIESGKSRAKPLENKETIEASGSSRKEVEEEREEKKKEPPLSPKRGKQKAQINPSAEISADQMAIATERGLQEAEAQAQFCRFRDWAVAKGQAYADWNAAWRNWITSPHYRPVLKHHEGASGGYWTSMGYIPEAAQ